jgi:rubrerythrin
LRKVGKWIEEEWEIWSSDFEKEVGLLESVQKFDEVEELTGITSWFRKLNWKCFQCGTRTKSVMQQMGYSHKFDQRKWLCLSCHERATKYSR